MQGAAGCALGSASTAKHVWGLMGCKIRSRALGPQSGETALKWCRGALGVGAFGSIFKAKWEQSSIALQFWGHLAGKPLSFSCGTRLAPG